MASNSFKISSIKSRVTALTLAIFIIGVWLLSYDISQKLQKDIAKQISEQQLSTTALLANQINNDLVDRQTTLEDLAKRIGQIGLDDQAQLQSFLDDRFVIKRDFNVGASIINFDGNVIASVPSKFQRIGINYRDRAFIATALDKGKPTISEIFIGKVLQNFVFGLAVPIRNSQGKVIGALAGGIDLTKPNFLDKIADNRFGKTGYFLLEDQKTRIIITSTDKRRVLQQQLPPGTNRLVDRHLQGYEESGITTNTFGVEVLASAKRIPIANWVMVVAIPTAEAFAPIKEMQSRIIAIASLLTLILGAIIWWLLWRELSPIFSTIKKLGILARLETHNVLLPETKHGEIGDLIKAFNLLLTALQQREQALEESEFRWKFAIEGTGDGLWDWDIPNNTVYFSKTWKTMLGYSEGDISNNLSEWERLVHPDDLHDTMIAVQEHLDGKTPAYINEHRLLCKNGSYKWILDRGLVVSRDEQGKPLRAIGTHTDITERKQMEEFIRQQALYDPLTKLPNRRLLVDRLGLAMSTSKRTGSHGALLFLDLDNFKPLNDTHGHEAGDLLLIEVANRIRRCLRETDTVARLGGDEFVIVLAQLDIDKNISKQQAEMLAEKIRTELAKTYALELKGENGKVFIIEHHCTASIGVTLFIDERSFINDILKNADDAMYQAKNAGRNRVCFYDSNKKT
jgi:diguanylate cyclase (GGDEF)-like protein/PAS domain S-box-containing protein